MEVSKLEISEEVRTYGGYQRKVLEWMLEHPKMLRDTNKAKLARTIGLTDGIHMTEAHIRQAISRMLTRELLLKRGSKVRYDIFFNFQHHRFPKDLVEKYAESIEHDGPVTEIKEKHERLSLPMRIISFLRQHPESGKNTTTRQIALEIKSLEPKAGLNPSSLEVIISRLARNGQIIKEYTGTKNGVNLYNYSLPDDKISPDWEYEEAKENKTPEEQADIAERTIVDVDRRIREEIAESGAPGTEEPTAETVCPEPITVKADGGEVKLSITLNINITR